MKFGMSSYEMHLNCTLKDICSQEVTLFFDLLILKDFIFLISNPNGDM